MARKQRQWQQPDLVGTYAVVTGTTSGLGAEVATRLAAAGAEVVLAVRDVERGDAQAQELREATGSSVWARKLDLSDLATVRSFAHGLVSEGRPVDLLINNAGMLAPKQRRVSVDGLELQLSTNYVGHYLLTQDLLALLRQAGGRVVTLSSMAAWIGRINFAELRGDDESYRPETAYAQSKLACLLMARELHRRSAEGGWGVASFASHPGGSPTNLFSSALAADGRRPTLSTRLMWATRNIPGLWNPSDQAALPTLLAATDADAVSGSYYGPTGLLTISGAPGINRMPRPARNDELAAQLWDETADRLRLMGFGVD